MGLPSVEVLTVFRMPSLPSGLQGHSAGHRFLRAERPRRVHGLGGRGASGQCNSFGRWRSHTNQCEKLAFHGCSSTFFIGVSVRQSFRQGLRRPVVVRCREKASGCNDITNFFLDELIEARSTVEKLAEPESFVDLFHPLQDEGTSQRQEDEDRKILSEADSNWDNLSDSESRGLPKLPLESNGPPMAILQRYLKVDNSQEQAKEKLRHLPLPMPHKVRPVGLPRPSLRRRLGMAYSRKSVPAGQDSASFSDT